MNSRILLEVFCLKDTDENANEKLPPFCCSTEHVPSYGCLFNKCPFAAFTSCENTLCYVGQNSVAEAAVSLGEEHTHAQISLWEDISLRKIDEAWDELNGYTKKG